MIAFVAAPAVCSPLPPTLSSALPAGLAGLAAADFDGDGAIDLAWADGSPTRLVWAKNDGSGTFSVLTELDLDGSTVLPASTGAADVDGDGFTDLFALVDDPAWRGWPGSAKGFELPAWTLPADADADLRVASSAGDLDGDGHTDLVLGLTPYLVGPTAAPPLDGGLVTPSRVVPVGDLDGDGTDDLLVPDHVPGGGFYGYPEGPMTLFVGPARTALWTVDLGSGSGVDAVRADVDGDGQPELVALAAAIADESVAGDVVVLGDLLDVAGPTERSRTPIDVDGGEGFALFALDADGDGDDEVGIGYERVLVALDWDPVAGLVPSGVTWAHPAKALQQVLTTDLDLDGEPDLVAGFADAAGSVLSVWLSTAPPEPTDPGTPGPGGTGPATSTPATTAGTPTDVATGPVVAEAGGCGCSTRGPGPGWVVLGFVLFGARRRLRRPG